MSFEIKLLALEKEVNILPSFTKYILYPGFAVLNPPPKVKSW